jgi:hypothetical protein
MNMTLRGPMTPMPHVLRAAVMTVVAVAVIMFAGAWGSEPLAAQSGSRGDVLARSIALYPTLASYADTGTVVIEGPGVVDRSKFRTYYRRDSLDFFFDFQGVAKQGAGGSLDMSFHRIVSGCSKASCSRSTTSSGPTRRFRAKAASR